MPSTNRSSSVFPHLLQDSCSSYRPKMNNLIIFAATFLFMGLAMAILQPYAITRNYVVPGPSRCEVETPRQCNSSGCDLLYIYSGKWRTDIADKPTVEICNQACDNQIADCESRCDTLADILTTSSNGICNCYRETRDENIVPGCLSACRNMQTECNAMCLGATTCPQVLDVSFDYSYTSSANCRENCKLV